MVFFEVWVYLAADCCVLRLLLCYCLSVCLC
jgi:hypothetical protein